MAPRQQGGNTRRIGELAAATGLTVRTLHYYEEIGLLIPSGRTNAGHRLDEAGRIRTRLAVLLDSAGATDGRLSDELLTLLEEMTMLDTTAQRRITLLVYADIAAAHDWLVRVFGLGPGRVDRDKEGRAVHGELYAGDGVIWMHREEKASALASPRSVGAATASVAVMVDDVDAHYRHAASEGATIVYEPVDQPYGYRVYSAHDLEGHLWSFMKPFA